jgi:hypothetical protein
MSVQTFVGQRGFTEVYRDDEYTYIYHNGNMYDTEKHIRKNFDSMYFDGAYNRLVRQANVIKDGSPDYSFVLRVPTNVFNALIKDNHDR